MAPPSASDGPLKTMLVVDSPVSAVARVMVSLTEASLGTRPDVFAPYIQEYSFVRASVFFVVVYMHILDKWLNVTACAKNPKQGCLASAKVE